MPPDMDRAALLQELRNETLPLVPKARGALETARGSQRSADVAPVRELLHKVAGTAAPVGLPHLSKLARFGEELAVLILSGDAKTSDAALTLLGRVLDAVEEDLAASGDPPPPSVADAGLPRPPRTPPTGRAAAPAPLPAPILESDKAQVLMVDGDAVSSKLFTRFLKDKGFDLRGVKSGEAIATLEAGFGDLLLIDLSGPGPFDAAAKVVAEGKVRHVPVVLLSKLPRTDGLVAQLAAEADEYLVKPVQPEDLGARLKSQAERRRAIRSARARAPTGRIDAGRRPAPEPPAGTLTVLVVDDSRVIRGLVKEFLAESKISIVEAEDGQAALDVLQGMGTPPAAAIVDMQMPVLDGLGLTRAVRAHSRFSTLPIVLLSAQDDAASMASAKDAGANAYLVKSKFDAPELRKALRNLGVAVAEPL
jgi:two-component system, chemotaxis family, chemotaxis protein CheY